MTAFLTQYSATINSIMASELSPANMEDLYVPGVRGFDWQTGKRSPDQQPGAYEELLVNFLLQDPGSSDQFARNTLIMVGGIGTGKTSSVRYAVRRAAARERYCSQISAMCKQPPVAIVLDLTVLSRGGSSAASSGTSDFDRFWNLVSVRLEQHLPADWFAAAQFVDFWNWCRTRPTVLARMPSLNRLLLANQHKLLAVSEFSVKYADMSREEVAESLVRERDAYVKSLGFEELAWYGLFFTRYSLQTRGTPCPCYWLLLDNVDHLEPSLQRVAVDFAMQAAEILGARTIIQIRPLTWERGVSAHALPQTETHIAPAIRDVLERRVSQLGAHLPVEAASGLRSLLNRLYRSYAGALFDACAGHGVRFALRNFSNLTLSPLLRGDSKQADPFGELQGNRLVRAFMWADGPTIVPHAYENLYRIGSGQAPEHLLVKSRILDLLIRIEGGRSTVARLFEMMSVFGVTAAIFCEAINELMLKTRPLVWCQGGNECPPIVSTDAVMATPIGLGYYEVAFGSPYYIEACIAQSVMESVRLETVYEFHQSCEERDLEEVRHAVSTKDVWTYHRLYGSGSSADALTAMHAERVVNGLRGIFGLSWQVKFPRLDPKRPEWVRERVREILRAYRV